MQKRFLHHTRNVLFVEKNRTIDIFWYKENGLTE